MTSYTGDSSYQIHLVFQFFKFLNKFNRGSSNILRILNPGPGCISADFGLLSIL